MQYRRLGSSGLEVSVMGLGTNSFGSRSDQDLSIRILHTAIDAGVNFIDTANIYSGTRSEEIIGEGLKGRRHDVVLATKAGLPRHNRPNGKGSSRAHVFQEIDESLTRLQTDYVDLYQIHSFDPHTPLEETLRALDDLVRSGKVRYIGASNYMAWELMKALSISHEQGLARYISIQPSYSMADRSPERELVALCLDQGVGIIPYFPLAGGILTGKYAGRQVPNGSRAETNPAFINRLDDERLHLGDKVSAVATQLSCSASALSLAWLYTRPAVATVIVGATRPDQVIDNLTSVELALSDEIIDAFDEASMQYIYGKPFAEFRLD